MNVFELLTLVFFVAIGVAVAKLGDLWFGWPGAIVGFVVGALAFPLVLWLLLRMTRLRPPSE